MAQGSNQIGEAFVDLRLRMDKLEADAAQANQKLQAVVDRLENVAENTDKSARAAGGWAASLTGVWTVYNSIVGTMRTAVGVGEAIGRLLVVNTEKTDALIVKLSKANSIARGAVTNDEVLAKRDALRRYEDAEPRFLGPLGGLLGGLYAAGNIGRALYAFAGADYNSPRQVQAELERLERTQQLEVGGKMSAEANIATQLGNQGQIMDFRGNVAGLTGNVNGLRESIDRLNETMRSLPR